MNLFLLFPEFVGNPTFTNLLHDQYMDKVIAPSLESDVHVFNLFIVTTPTLFEGINLSYFNRYLTISNLKDYLNIHNIIYYEYITTCINQLTIVTRTKIEYYNFGIKLLKYTDEEDFIAHIIPAYLYSKCQLLINSCIPTNIMYPTKILFGKLSDIHVNIDLNEVYNARITIMKKRKFYKFIDRLLNPSDYWIYMTQWHGRQNHFRKYDLYKEIRGRYYNRWYCKWISLYRIREIYNIHHRWENDLNRIKWLIYFEHGGFSFKNKKYLIPSSRWYFYKDKKN